MDRNQEQMTEQDKGSPADPTPEVPAAPENGQTVLPAKPETDPPVRPAEPAAEQLPAVEPAELADDFDVIAAIPVEPWPAPQPEAPSTSALPVAAPVPAPGAAKAAESTRPAAVQEARNMVFGSQTRVPEPSREARDRRAARDAALDSKPPLGRVLQVMLAIAFPFLLLIAAVRLIASTGFLWIAYQRPGFPADTFGFSTGDRLTFGSYGVDYLNNVADSRYLSGLRFENGAPMFNESEVSHMLDVKNVIGYTYLAGAILAVLVLLCLLYLGRRYAGGIRRGLFAGAVATVVLIGALAGLAAWNWEGFFTSFHEVFFANGTWTFNYSDTLIRLYPPQFWVDAGIGIGVIVLGVAVAVLIRCWPTARRRERSRLLQQSRVYGLDG